MGHTSTNIRFKINHVLNCQHVESARHTWVGAGVTWIQMWLAASRVEPHVPTETIDNKTTGCKMDHPHHHLGVARDAWRQHRNIGKTTIQTAPHADGMTAARPPVRVYAHGLWRGLQKAARRSIFDTDCTGIERTRYTIASRTTVAVVPAAVKIMKRGGAGAGRVCSTTVRRTGGGLFVSVRSSTAVLLVYQL